MNSENQITTANHKMKSWGKHCQSGFSMVEVMVAILLLTVGLLGLANMQTQAVARQNDLAAAKKNVSHLKQSNKKLETSYQASQDRVKFLENDVLTTQKANQQLQQEKTGLNETLKVAQGKAQGLEKDLTASKKQVTFRLSTIQER